MQLPDVMQLCCQASCVKVNYHRKFSYTGMLVYSWVFSKYVHSASTKYLRKIGLCQCRSMCCILQNMHPKYAGFWEHAITYFPKLHTSHIFWRNKPFFYVDRSHYHQYQVDSTVKVSSVTSSETSNLNRHVVVLVCHFCSTKFTT